MKKMILFLLCMNFTWAQSVMDKTVAELEQLHTKKSKNTFEYEKGILLKVITAENRAIVADWASSKPISANTLWKVLDAEAMGGEWHELFEDQDVSNEIKALYQKNSKQKWILHSGAGFVALAEVWSMKGRHYLRVASLKGNTIQYKEKMLTLNFDKLPMHDFLGDWSTECLNGKTCELSHSLQPLLELKTYKNPKLTLSYKGRGKALELPANCFKLNDQEKGLLVENYKMYIEFQILKMVNAFVKPLETFYSWPSWEFMVRKSKHTIADKELNYFAQQCLVPSKTEVLNFYHSKGTVSFSTDFRGSIWMDVYSQ